MKNWSQDGEQEILQALCKRLGIGETVGPCVAVEFGGFDGASNSNIRWCVEEGWRVEYWDCEPKGGNVRQVAVTPDNVNALFAEYRLNDCAICSIDIDSNDYWVWKALAARPKIVVIEYNPAAPAGAAVVYDPALRFQKTDYYGASWEALVALGKAKGYDVHAASGLNLIFVRADLGLTAPPTVERPHRPRGWPADTTGRPWVSVV